MTKHSEKPWYKEKYLWMVISLPILTVVAGVTTVIIAYNQSDSLVNDDYFKQGLAINVSLAKQKYAQQIGLSAKLEFDIESQLLLVNLKADKAIKGSILLDLSHPTKKQLDKKITLSLLSGNDFVADLPKLNPSYWYVKLQDENQQWILKSRWKLPEQKILIINPLK